MSIIGQFLSLVNIESIDKKDKLTPKDAQEGGRHSLGDRAVSASLVAGAALAAIASVERIYTNRMVMDGLVEDRDFALMASLLCVILVMLSLPGYLRARLCDPAP